MTEEIKKQVVEEIHEYLKENIEDFELEAQLTPRKMDRCRAIGSIEERMTKLISKPASLDSIAPYWDKERKGVVIPLIGKVLHAKCIGKADWEEAKRLAKEAGGELFSKKEGYILAYYKDEINELLEAHGGDELEGCNWCSSAAIMGAWFVNFSGGNVHFIINERHVLYVRAVSAL